VKRRSGCFRLAALAAVLSAIPLAGQAEERGKLPSWCRLITSPDEEDRERGERMALMERAETVEYLLSVVESPVEEGEPFYISGTPRNTAIYLLGKMRAEEAVPVLMDWLLPKPGQNVSFVEDLSFSPAGHALAEIGKPAVRPLADAIAKHGVTWPYDWFKNRRELGNIAWYDDPQVSSPLGDRCLSILAYIKDPDGAIVYLQRRARREEDPATRTHLQRAVTTLRELGESYGDPEYLEDLVDLRPEGATEPGDSEPEPPEVRPPTSDPERKQ
jgi:hypothetical protein